MEIIAGLATLADGVTVALQIGFELTAGLSCTGKKGAGVGSTVKSGKSRVSTDGKSDERELGLIVSLKLGLQFQSGE